MSLNCLSCQDLQRSGSEREWLQCKSHRNKLSCIKEERSWSGNLSLPCYGEMGRNSTAVAARKVIKKEPRRLNSTGGVAFKGCEEPKLVRSSGMRRDWSFEDLRKAYE
ncbi:unnamed protein product [Dovyalis caffra]|uniref:Uncharacterized protein n=1 Tax=Dovyalis caffra TaxID=77055 RepID=A0AAV1ST30_9ROSI|nr:unnamed protein product [Dovyalis caffra]